MSKTKESRSEEHSRPVILMIIGGLGAGGKEQQLLSLLKGIKERDNYSAILVAMNPHGSREDEARQYVDQLIIIERNYPFEFFSPLVRVIQIARRFRVSLIHSWGSGIWDLLGLCASRWLRIPFLHGGIQSAPTSLKFNNWVSKWSANHADGVVANSIAGLTAFGQEKNLKAKVIYNGLDVSRFEGIEPGQIEYDLCMVANFRKQKDHQTLVNAMALISKIFPQAKLLLVGHDAGTLTSTRMLVNQLDLDDSIVFVEDCLKPYHLIANSRVCVLATYTEGVSNSILEYCFLSKPVVATYNAGNSEIIIDGINGYLVESQSAEALTDKVILLLKNPELAKQLGTRGKEMVTEKFDVEKMINSFESVYLDLIEGMRNQ